MTETVQKPDRLTTSSSGKAIVLYDGLCRLCQRSIQVLKKMDWLERFEYQNSREPERLPECEEPLVPEQLLEQMHLVTPDRKTVYRGFAAFRWMAWRMPLTWLVAPFLYLPGMNWLGSRAYLWVARNRFKLVPCKDGVCSLPQRDKL